MNCWSMPCQSKLTLWEHWGFVPHRVNPGALSPNQRSCLCKVTSPRSLLSGATAVAVCPAVPAALADGAAQVPQGHRSSHTSLHHLHHPPLLLSP